MASSGPAPLISDGFSAPQMFENLMPMFNQISGAGSGQGSGFTYPSPNGFSEFFTPNQPTMMSQPYIPNTFTGQAPQQQPQQPQQPASIAANPYNSAIQNFNNTFADMLFGI